MPDEQSQGERTLEQTVSGTNWIWHERSRNQRNKANKRKQRDHPEMLFTTTKYSPGARMCKHQR